jgi:hypothetical protein
MAIRLLRGKVEFETIAKDKGILIRVIREISLIRVSQLPILKATLLRSYSEKYIQPPPHNYRL